MNLNKEKTWGALHHPSHDERNCSNCKHFKVMMKIPPGFRNVDPPRKSCSIRAGMICDIYNNSIPSVLERKWEWNWKYE